MESRWPTRGDGLGESSRQLSPALFHAWFGGSARERL